MSPNHQTAPVQTSLGYPADSLPGSPGRYPDLARLKPVLLISYYYPPSTAVGAVRPSKFAAHLPAVGWHPTIITASSQNLRGDDDHLPPGAAGAKYASVHHVAEWPHPLKAYERFRERTAAQRGQALEHAARIILPYAECYKPTRGGLKRWLLAFLSLPDRETAWLMPALLRGLREIRAHGVRHVVTTGPPFSCHVIGLLLKRLTGIAWIAEFRDPWSLRHKYPVFRNGVTDLIETRLIASVMEHADVILSVTPAMTAEAKHEHPGIPGTRFHTLTSGFDPAELSAIHWRRPYPDPVVFSYFGTFYHGRTPEPFLGALKSLLDDGSLKPRDVRVRLVGQVRLADGAPVADMVKHLGLEGLVSLHAPVPRREALKQTLESHVVLVLDERHPVQIPLKLYDALAAGVTVFNVGSGGASAELVRRTRRGVAVSYERPAEVRAGILECVQRVRAGASQLSSAPWEDPCVREFDFRRLTESLAACLNRL